eukprot:TRINITY_DN1885_c0_g1_i1.p1 TRINITY_DN1885_c0_g1~~TRINITY_DN1885_c0_g1_i1.p1  ORF type:complete len:162 (+),score=44.02 TRINITY_DN1885_c0_g1_i1:55-540(+)
MIKMIITGAQMMLFQSIVRPKQPFNNALLVLGCVKRRMYCTKTTPTNKGKPTLKKSEDNTKTKATKDGLKEQAKKQSKEGEFKLNNRDLGVGNLRAMGTYFANKVREGDKNAEKEFLKWHESLPSPPGRGEHGLNQPILKQRKKETTKSKETEASPPNNSL